MPLLYFFAGFALDHTPDDSTFSVCMMAIGCLSCSLALGIHADPHALALGAFFIVLISAWSKVQPSILNNRMLAVWLLFLPHLRDVCTRVTVDGRWVENAMANGFRGR